MQHELPGSILERERRHLDPPLHQRAAHRADHRRGDRQVLVRLAGQPGLRHHRRRVAGRLHTERRRRSLGQPGRRLRLRLPQPLADLRYYAGGSRTDKTDYTYDALDRTTKEVEDHTGTGKDRTTTLSYQGLTNLVTQEQQAGGTDPKTKTYAYDAYGHRLSLTDKNNATGATTSYSYGTDVHGSVSQLLDDAGDVKASYGYSAYGGSDAPGLRQAPLNPYRFSNRRMDSGTAASTTQTVPTGSSGYDLGARRFGPDIGGFLQQDMFEGALADLGLASDPLTQNRYALAGGNPIN
jgi:hypothetical protein